MRSARERAEVVDSVDLNRRHPCHGTGVAMLVWLAVPSIALGQDSVSDWFFDAAGVKIHYTEQGSGEPVL